MKIYKNSEKKNKVFESLIHILPSKWTNMGYQKIPQEHTW